MAFDINEEDEGMLIKDMEEEELSNFLYNIEIEVAAVSNLIL